MQKTKRSLKKISITAEQTIQKIGNPEEIIIVRNKIALLKSEGKTLLDYLWGKNINKKKSSSSAKQSKAMLSNVGHTLEPFNIRTVYRTDFG